MGTQTTQACENKTRKWSEYNGGEGDGEDGLHHKVIETSILCIGLRSWGVDVHCGHVETPGLALALPPRTQSMRGYMLRTSIMECENFMSVMERLSATVKV